MQPQFLESGKADECPVVDDNDLVGTQTQGLESGKAGERPVVDGGDLNSFQVPVKARNEQAM